MKNLLRKYIKERVEFIFEEDAASAAASAAQGTNATGTISSSDANADSSANYEELKNSQLSQINFLNDKLKKEKLMQKVNLDKIKKLMLTFSQVQDSDLALIQGGKSEDNKVKKMKQDEYNKNKKEIETSIKSTEDQIVKAGENIKNIDRMIAQSKTTSNTINTPSSPIAP